MMKYKYHVKSNDLKEERTIKLTLINEKFKINLTS